jgi:cell division protein FtsW (lipid II flippase)
MSERPTPPTFNPSLQRGLVPLVASVGFGLIILALSDTATTLLIVQLAALIVGCGLAWGVSRLRGWETRLEPVAWVGIGLLAATVLWGEPIQGVRRWLGVGPVRVHTAALFLPIILVACSTLLHRDKVWRALALPIVAMPWLLRQPDASFATALAFGTMFAVDAAPEKYRWRWPLMVVLVALAAFAWHWDIPLEPVAHTEDVILLAEAQHTALAIAALVALATAVLSPILALGTPKEGAARMAALTLTGAFGVLAVVPLLEPFPVPLVGYGASPILGMCMGVGLVVSMSAHEPQ